jgi:hypothetical protein
MRDNADAPAKRPGRRVNYEITSTPAIYIRLPNVLHSGLLRMTSAFIINRNGTTHIRK